MTSVCVAGAGTIGSLLAAHLARVTEVSVLTRREEHARALYWLSKLYDSVKKDKGKAAECVEKLKSKEFEGAEYARRLAAETK